MLFSLFLGYWVVVVVTLFTCYFYFHSQNPSLVKRCRHLSDTCVRLESFAGSDKETHPLFKDYHGLFHVTKLSAINTIMCHIPESIDLAFKLRRKKFLIEVSSFKVIFFNNHRWLVDVGPGTLVLYAIEKCLVLPASDAFYSNPTLVKSYRLV